jgi:hypothetical protein
MITHDASLYAHLHDLAAAQHLVFFAGLPGTGKSLLSHQLAHLAHAMGRTVHLLQWDVARPVFEASAAGQRYPVVGGVTHDVIRYAVGHWARQALVLWAQRHSAPQHLLIGETPLVGHRLLELAITRADMAEELLRTACFVVPVPSPAVRAWLEAERQRRSLIPLHPREREDAPPQVLRDLWQQLAAVAPQLGVTPTTRTETEASPYDPLVYRAVYERLLAARQVLVLPIATRFPTATFSVYDFAVPTHEVVPTEEEAIRAIREVEQRYPDLRVLQEEITQWYRLT